MSKGAIAWWVVGAAVACCAYTHRRVIRALVRHEPMPKAPAWHVWVPKKNRRDKGA